MTAGLICDGGAISFLPLMVFPLSRLLRGSRILGIFPPTLVDFQGQFFHMPFPVTILNHFGADINMLELLPIMVALKLWGFALWGSRFVLQRDNNSVLALNSGRSRSLCMQLCLREIWFLSACYDFEMIAVHVPARHNTVAYHLSRRHLSPYYADQFQLHSSDISTSHVACPSHYFDFQITF